MRGSAVVAGVGGRLACRLLVSVHIATPVFGRDVSEFRVEKMATANYETNGNYSRTPASRRKLKREQQYASTLVHYLGVERALAVCRENMWTGVRQAILEQQDVRQTRLH